ncbi:MAG: hypothetical protein NTZ85_12790 [Bacteroidia bacterium]|nr:hypothetical protein [Bacteroidia bacterium]
MKKLTRLVRKAILFMGTFFLMINSFGQGGFDNSTRAVYIFDMARYINYGPGFADSAVFKIGLLDEANDLLFEMGNLAKTRKTIQNKPIQIIVFRGEEKIVHTQILDKFCCCKWQAKV